MIINRAALSFAAPEVALIARPEYISAPCVSLPCMYVCMYACTSFALVFFSEGKLCFGSQTCICFSAFMLFCRRAAHVRDKGNSVELTFALERSDSGWGKEINGDLRKLRCNNWLYFRLF